MGANKVIAESSMSLPDELKPIFDRIAQHQQTDADMELLRQYLSTGGQLVSQQGKYAVNLGQGQDIHIGDRIYQGTDAETISNIVRTMIQELQAQPNGVPATEPKTAPKMSSSQRQRMEHRQACLQAEWDLRNQKMQRLRSALAIEAGTSVKFQLERELADEEAQLNRLSEDLDQIERTTTTVTPHAASPGESVAVSPRKSVTNRSIASDTALQEELEQLGRDLLVRKWVQANFRTRSIILKTVDREKERWLTEQQIHEFPDLILEKIDRLWSDASSGKFGFRQQLSILEQHNQVPQLFGEQVGWFVENSWIKQDSQLSIDIETAPAGHFPWSTLPMITMDNTLLNGFVLGLRTVNQQFIKKEWQRQLIADFMASAGWLIRDRIDKEEFKRSLEYELSHNEPWWEGDRVEELKVNRLFALLLSHRESLKD
jgi:Effector-associated domain 10/GUN4-like